MAEQLTEDIWALILRHVPPAHRFSSCALVSQKLHKAAAAATDALELAFYGQQQRAEAFKGYLQQHGSQLTSLQLQHRVQQPLAQLPCSRLLCLVLSGGATVQLGPHNSLPGVLASCTGLTRLDLSQCLQVSAGLSGLSVLAKLRDLQLVLLSAPLPGAVLPCMQHLTRLQLSYVAVEDVHHVSCLSSLAELSISSERSVRLAPDIAPGFVLPASLHDLSLTGTGLELGPAVLSAAVQLTRLELHNVKVVGQGDTSGGAALLAAVSGLQLATLELKHLYEQEWPQPSAAYQALTASSRLQKLVLLGCAVPDGVWEHFFPPAAVHGELQRLEMGHWIDFEEGVALVRCCPRLQHLQLSTRSCAAVAALKPLTCLSSLTLFANYVSGGADAAECVQGIAAITSLRDLSLFLGTSGRRIDRAALLPLTALTQLTHCNTFQGDLTNQAGPGQPPDVWQQLRQVCLAGDTC